ncbi:MAG TPA: DUF2911 domain-containing protein [Gemmatimonadaceae bacterium]|jgi:hypothetical protein
MIRRALALLATALTLGAQQPISSGAFVVRLGRDTLSVEQFTRTTNRLEGDLVRRSPTTNITHYIVNTNADGSIASAELTMKRADGSVVRSLSPTIAAGSFVMLPESYAPYELWLAQLRSTKRDSADVTVVAPLGGPSGKLATRMLSRDSVRVWFFGSPMRLRVDAAGRLLGLDGRATTLKYEVTRVASVNIATIAASFASGDAAGKSYGVFVSRRDTLRAQVGGANVWIDYGRPLARGRDVFNRGVLGDTLWRTGANAATQFHTDKDLLIGGKRLAAGTYTLWTRVSGDNSSYTLLFNSQIGQWGTEYHADRDILGVPLRAATVPVTEEFTIGLDATSPASDMTFAWGTLRLSVRVEPAG